MPRRPRIKLAGIPQHIVQRGINQEACFFAEEDYHCYLHWLMTKVLAEIFRSTKCHIELIKQGR